MIVAIATLTATAEIRVVKLGFGVNLNNVLTEEEVNTVDSLKITGHVDALDFNVLHEMVNNKLTYVDMSECDAEDNKIPNKAFGPISESYESLKGGSNLSYIALPKNLEVIGLYAFMGARIKELNLPTTLKRIEQNAFSNCANLTEIIIPEGVNFVGDNAFSKCYSVEKLSIPTTLRTISCRTFSDLTSLKSIELPEGVEEIDDEAFCGTSNLQKEEIVIPSTIKTIGHSAFNGVNIANLRFEGSFPEITAGAFYASGVSNIEWAEDVKTIESYAFAHCSSITELYLPSTLETIGTSAFSTCGNLKKVVLPENLQVISNYAFKSCSDLNDVYSKSPIAPTLDYAGAFSLYIFENPKAKTLYVPEGAKAAYEAAAYWKNFGAIVEVSEFPSAGREAVIADGAGCGRVQGTVGAAIVDGGDGGESYAIFRTDGSVAAAGVAEGRTTIPLPAGIYVASVGGKARRIAVR